MERRKFLRNTGLAIGATMMYSPLNSIAKNLGISKKRLALVGTGIRGTSLWGKTLAQRYGANVSFVGLCDINPGRLRFGKNFIGVGCPVFTDFEEMMRKTKPDTLIVTTKDSTHHEFIIKGMEMGADIITEKPMTTDETKCQAILDAEKRTGKKITVTFNYRYGNHATRIKELLLEKRIGDIISVDFHWYLNVYHGASYFRRWHRLKENGGSLLVHKATHHFDLMNWWLDTEPEEVFAYGDLEHYGRNNSYRHTHCRPCPHKEKCKFYWDITKDKRSMDLYVANENYDGYLRDGCLWKEDINIYDKMAVQVKYANNVYMSYSLTTYSPYEGWRIGFNGTKGRLDSWLDIPWQKGMADQIDQSKLYEKGMNTEQKVKKGSYYEIMVMDNFGDYELIMVPKGSGGHGGGDPVMQERIFRNLPKEDPLRHLAGSRDGAMSILTGIAARNSIEAGKKVKIADLTSLKPRIER